jgi:hypothetical protein
MILGDQLLQRVISFLLSEVKGRGHQSRGEISTGKKGTKKRK